MRASPRRLLLLTASVAVGVAALVAVNSFTDNLRDSVRRQAQSLLGADLSLESRRPLSPSVERLVDTLTRQGARSARLINFDAMAYVPRTTGARMVQVAAIDGPYPFYGAIRTDPASAWARLQSGPFLVADPSLLTALGARVGDTLAVGEARFTIIGTIASAPGNVGFRAAFGPRVYLPARYVERTGLLGFGARAEYELYLKIPSGQDPQQIADRERSRLSGERIRLRTVLDDQESLNKSLSQLADISVWWLWWRSSSAASAWPVRWWSSSGSGWTPSRCSAASAPPAAGCSRSTRRRPRRWRSRAESSARPRGWRRSRCCRRSWPGCFPWM